MSFTAKSFRLVFITIALLSLVAIGTAANWSSISELGFLSSAEISARESVAPPFVGEVTLTATGGSPTGTFTTLKEAFDAVNAGTHTGTIAISINADTTETAPAVLNASGSGAASYTAISIQPAGGAARTISGAIAAGSPMIDFNGADNVTIDGLNTGGNTLTISNTTASATSGTSTIRFIGGATNNTITNSTILGSHAASVATNGATIFFSTDAATANGNDNNTISNNNLGPAGANLPTKAILGNGSTTTTAIGNSGIVINNNNIFDYFGAAVTSAGVATNGGCNTWSITNNRFYQTVTRTWTTGALHNAINIANTTATSGAQAFTITGNIVGFASNTQTGVYTMTGSTGKFQGIVFNGITGGTSSTINNNTVAAVSLTGVTSSGTSTASPMVAIMPINGVVETNNNTIGSQSTINSLVFSTNTTTAADVYGIFNFSVNNWTSNNNNIGGIQVTNVGASGTFLVYGMRANTGTTVTWTANDNVIGGPLANTISLNGTGTASQVVGMQTPNAISTFTRNRIRNLSSNIGTGTTTAASVAGIIFTSATPVQTVSQNIITGLTNTNTTAASVVTGIQFTGGTGNLVERNSIADLTVATNSTAAEVNGIRVGGGTTTYRNNMINLGAGVANAIGTVSTAGVSGFYEFLGTNTIYHNSIYIGGSPTAGAGPSYAFNGQQTVNTRTFRNNIFYNARNNSGATGKNYAVRVGGSSANPTGLTINNNVYFANGAGAVFGFFNAADVANLAAWQTAVGQDANSFESNPLFVSTTDLHLQAGSPAIDTAAASLASNDFDGKSRPGANALFDIGADERDGIAPVANDMQATAFVDPSSGGAKLVGSTFSPQASFTNNGTNTQTSVTVRYRICADVGCATVLYNQTAVIPSIASLATTNVTFPSASIGTVGAYTIKAASELVSDTVPANNEITGTLNIQGPLSGSYTVGSGGNYSSLTNGGGVFDAINSLGASGPVTINITSDLTGETGAVSLNPIVGNPAVLIRPSGAPRTISGVAPVAVIRINGADNIRIDGSTAASVVGGNPALRELTVRNLSTSTSSGVIHIGSATEGSSGNTIRNVNVVGDTPTTTLSGVTSGAATPGSVALFANNNNTIANCSVQRVVFGIASLGVAPATLNTGTVISENDLSATGANRIRRIGIYVTNESGTQIDQNSIGGIDNTGESADAVGIAAGVQALSDTTTTTTAGVIGASISRNKINGVSQDATFSAAGILVAGITGGTNTVVNNMITGVISDGDSGDLPAGIFVVGVTGSTTRLLHNSVSMTGDRSSLLTPSTAMNPGFALAISGTDPTVELKNNIFYSTQIAATGGADATSYGIGMQTTTFANLDSNYNDFWSTGANDGGFRSGSLDRAADATTEVDYVTLALWQAAVADDANSQEVDPAFVNPVNDLHLNAVTTPLSGDGIGGFATVDHDGEPRPAGTGTEIGADELTDTVNPDTAIDPMGPGTPTNPTTSTSATFTFGGTDSFAPNVIASFECALDTPTFTACPSASPVTYNSLALGSHTFQVRAVDTAGNVDPSPASFTWNIVTNGTLALSSTTYSVAENVIGGVATITVNRTGGTFGAVSADYSFTSGTATGGAACGAGIDFVNTGGTVNLADGQASNTFNVTICDDAVYEPGAGETFGVTLSNATGGATIGMPSSATVTITENDSPPSSINLTPAAVPTAVDNDYTRINNAVQTIAPGGTITLAGTFNWTETNAAASWALGSDGLPNTGDDYSVAVPANKSGVTFTAASLGSATIQGPGDLPNTAFEGVLYFDGSGVNQNWTISNMRFLDFDWTLQMYNGAGPVTQYNNTTIQNNYIRMARDIVAGAGIIQDEIDFQNAGIHYSFGANQIISGNTIDIAGDGVSDPNAGMNGIYAADIGMQSNTSGGAVYNGLQITGNTINVVNAQSSSPEVIIGIWENAHGHSSNITVSGNTFTNAAVGNDPATNIQRAFRITSHSSATTTVTYQDNVARGANMGFQWLSGSNFAGNQPIVVKRNTVTGGGTGFVVQSQGVANMSFNRIVGNTTGVQNVDGIVTAENNWWGCNTGPGTAGCNPVTGTVDFNPWIVLGVTATPSTISAGGNSTVTALMTTNSDNTPLGNTPPNVVPNMPVAYSATQGSMSPSTGTIGSPTAGQASSTFTSNSGNNGTGCATVDGQLVCANITVLPAPSVQFSAATYVEDESQTATIRITRVGDLSGTSTVNFSAAAGPGTTGGATCTPGVDFITVSNQLVTFAANDPEEAVTVTICGGDSLNETSDSVLLSLTSPSVGTSLGTPATATLNINDTATQFRQTGSIDMMLGQAANPYPSTITVTGGTTVIGAMRVTLYDVWHFNPDNMDVLLVGPNGQKYILMADVGGPTSIIQEAPVTVTFSDVSAAALPNGGPLTTGQFLPTSCETPVTNFPAGAPVGPYVEPGCTVARPANRTLFGNFGNTDSNGTWQLFVRDDNGQLRPYKAQSIVGQIQGGWGLEFLASTAAEVSVSGRVRNASGRGITNANVTVTGNSLSEPIRVVTGRSGAYTITGLTAGETYVVTVSSRRFIFSMPSRVVSLDDNLTDLDFTADPSQ